MGKGIEKGQQTGTDKIPQKQKDVNKFPIIQIEFFVTHLEDTHEGNDQGHTRIGNSITTPDRGFPHGWTFPRQHRQQ